MVKKILFGILFAICFLMLMALGIFGGKMITTSRVTKSLESAWQSGDLTFIPGNLSAEDKAQEDTASKGIEEEMRAEYGNLIPEEMFSDSTSSGNGAEGSLYALLMTKTEVKVKTNGFFFSGAIPVRITVTGPDMPAMLDEIFEENPEIKAAELRERIEGNLASGAFPQRERVVETHLRTDGSGNYIPDAREDLLDALYGDALSYYRDALLMEVPAALGLETEGGDQ